MWGSGACRLESTLYSGKYGVHLEKAYPLAFLYQRQCMSELPDLITPVRHSVVLTLCNPMECSPLGSSVHGILQARIPEWVAIPFSRGSFQLEKSTMHISVHVWADLMHIMLFFNRDHTVNVAL